ncbi:hypothetical protein RFI_16979 [Reticulomyxa filosa]|uniref:Uncharacterized protein n=1 Tax=Reticulomyxa filosa TaxID=46433 RepID=X6N3B0_RETFI|nr:hypothetical protein RFI_16979 [Reticulomyxa filosa]|eukprot:ETO20239.1 hypothetical protein RFI_16979 [Reticulomyxa filosa]
MQMFEKEMLAEVEQHLDEYKKLTQFKWTTPLSKKCRQDDDLEFGLRCQVSEQQLLNMQTSSDDVAFHPKHVYDFDMYLNELLTRAHTMNDAFQTQMEDIFRACKGCTFERGPIKTHERCKLKAQVDYKNEVFPKSAHVIDVLRCQVTFVDIRHLMQGLDYFTDSVLSSQYRDKFKVVRVKNGFEEYSRQDQDNDHDHSNSNSNSNSSEKKTKLPNIPREYKDVKMNILFIKEKASIVCEVHTKRILFYEISRQELFLMDSSKIIDTLSFDVQLQIASFNPKDVANLMLYFPNEFCRSQFILSFRNSNGGNFASQMANNSSVTFGYANALLHSGDFLPRELVQSQLRQTDNDGGYPLMQALWKQTSVACMKLFIPSDPDMARTVWNALDNDHYSCINFAVRNTNVSLASILALLQENIRDEKRWQTFVQTPETFVCFAYESIYQCVEKFRDFFFFTWKNSKV